LIRVHHVVATEDAAAKLSLESGVDIELPFASAYPTLREQVQQGSFAGDD